MTKRLMAVVFVLGTLAATTALADRAKLMVGGMGDGGMMLDSSGNGGSFYMDDPYNMFYNPAYINDYKNWGIIEKSNFPGGTAEGGFVTTIHNFNLGIFMNRGGTLAGTSYGNAAAVASVNNMRPIDVIFGSDMGVKWGIGATLAGFTAGTNTDTDLTLHAGVAINDIEPFAAFKVIGNDNLTNVGTTGKNTMMSVGVKYHWGEWTPYAAWMNVKQNPAGTGDDTTVYDAWGFGIGRMTKIGDGMKMGYAIAYFRGDSGTAANSGRSVIPINMMIEADANSWLTFRAGLQYNLMDQTNGNTNPDTTLVPTAATNTKGRIGASLHMGKADMDFAVGNGGPGAETGVSTDGQAFDFSNGLFAASSISYHW